MSRPRPRFVTQQQAAAHLGITDRTVRNMISRGDITGYRLPGVRAVRVDLDEIERAITTIPTLAPPRRKPFGPDAKIVLVGTPGASDTASDAEGQR